MKNHTRKILKIIYSNIRFSLVNLASKKIIHSFIVIISPKSKIVTNGNEIHLGNKCEIESGTLIKSTKGNIVIGEKVYINRNCNIVAYDQINIGDKTTIGPNTCIFDHNHAVGQKEVIYVSKAINIEENVWIGANVSILKGVNIGKNSVIGAGSVVTKNVEENSIYAGNPAIFIKKIEI